MVGPRGGVAAPPGPADRPLGGVADDGRLVGQPYDVVEHHRHVAAQGLLDGHRPFRRDGHQPAVDVRAEDGFLLGHFHAMGEAEDLEAAAVGQDRPVPAHEAVQAAQRGDYLFARPQREMIGIAQDHFRPAPADLFDLQPFDARLRGDGHEGGRCTSPCGVEKPPRRAAQRASTCSRRKEKAAAVIGKTGRSEIVSELLGY